MRLALPLFHRVEPRQPHRVAGPCNPRRGAKSTKRRSFTRFLVGHKFEFSRLSFAFVRAFKCPHTFADGTLCVHQAHEWNGNRLIASTIVPWICIVALFL